MSADEEQLALSREIQACEVRLRLLPPFESDDRNEAFKHELEQRRTAAAKRLGELQGNHRASNGAAVNYT
jgi:hypothetical protein